MRFPKKKSMATSENADIVLKLKQSLLLLKVRENRFKSYHILHAIIEEVYSFYKNNISSREHPILSNFYAYDSQNKISMLPSGIDHHLENLLYGRIKEFTIDFNGIESKIYIHKHHLDNNLPLIVMKSGEQMFAIKKRNIFKTHILLYRFQPILYGMKCDKNVAEDWVKNLDRDFLVSNDSEILSKMSALWLNVEVDTISSLLIIDGNELINFLQLVRTNPQLRCYFLLSGQINLFAYIQVNDDSGRVVSVLPIGSVEVKS